jgi:transposase
MRFYTKTHQHYCGIDLHAKTMYICILASSGKVLLHRNVKCNPHDFLNAIKPYREDLVVAVECMFTWYWIADLCAKEGIPFVLGHALYMKSIHGGKAKNDKIDSNKIAALLRGGLIPQAYAYPQAMRSTRDLLRRRHYFVRQRATLMAHIQNTHHQYNELQPEHSLAIKQHRKEIANTFDDIPLKLIVGTELHAIEYLDKVISQLELGVLHSVRSHQQDHYERLKSIPQTGKILALTMLLEIGDIRRFPKVQNFISYCRLVKCKSESAGKTKGTSGAKIGNAHLKWAFSEAAVTFLRTAEGKRMLHQLMKKHDKAKAISIIAARLARAVYFMLKNKRAFEMKRFMQR